MQTQACWDFSVVRRTVEGNLTGPPLNFYSCTPTPLSLHWCVLTFFLCPCIRCCSCCCSWQAILCPSQATNKPRFRKWAFCETTGVPPVRRHGIACRRESSSRRIPRLRADGVGDVRGGVHPGRRVHAGHLLGRPDRGAALTARNQIAVPGPVLVSDAR